MEVFARKYKAAKPDKEKAK